MKIPLLLLALVFACSTTCSEEMHKERPGVAIGRAVINHLPVVYKFVNKAPTDAERKALPLLAVIYWEYDGGDNNGMPPKAINDRMIALEDALESQVEKAEVCKFAYSRTGDNLKEIIYYIRDQDQFMKALNDALAELDRSPFEVKFYMDPEWGDFNGVRARFGKNGEQGVAPQSATRAESKTEGSDKTQPESKERSR